MNRLLEAFPKEDREILRPHMEEVTLDLHTPLIRPNEPIGDVWFPTTALASLVTVLEDGATVEGGSVGREGMVGIPVILHARSTPMETVVQVPGTAYRVPAAALMERFEQSGAVRALLHRYVHSLFIIASQSTACNRKHQVVERFARWLLMSSDGIGSNEVTITHEYLATMLGVRRPGVTDAALKLQDRGLITYRRGGTTIRDRPGLEEAACECYAAVKFEQDHVFDV
ncbi:MAG TPA: Crp/Fnr family transcriptional regulator [Thermoanaerobaculia bacterium]